MTSGEIIQLAVSGLSALICLYVRSELAKLRQELTDRISRLEMDGLKDETKMREWVRRNFKQLPHSILPDESEG